jgi:DNA polymerase III alpha subunit
MAFFTLEDTTGSISVNCFTNAYSKYAEFISEGAVIKIKGRCNKEVDSFNDEEVLKISAEHIEFIKENKEPIYISVSNIVEWSDDVYEKIKSYLSPSGHPLIVFDELTGALRKTKFTVGKEILNNGIGLRVRLSR